MIHAEDCAAALAELNERCGGTDDISLGDVAEYLDICDCAGQLITDLFAQEDVTPIEGFLMGLAVARYKLPIHGATRIELGVLAGALKVSRSLLDRTHPRVTAEDGITMDGLLARLQIAIARTPEGE